MIDRQDDGVRERIRVAPRHDQRVLAIGQNVDQTIGIGGDNGLAHRERLECRERGAFPERRKDTQVERRQRARDVAPEARKDESIAETERRCLRLKVGEQRTLADQEESRGRPLGRHPRRGVDQVRVAFRFVQSCDRPDREVVWRDTQVPARRHDLVGRSLAAELDERHAKVDDSHFGRRHLARADHEIGGALRDGDRDVGIRLEHAVGDLLKPRRVRKVGVFVQDRRNPPHRAGQAAEGGGPVPVKVEDVDLLLIDDAQESRERERVEFRPLHVGNIDAQRLERLLREILFAQAYEGYVELLAIEAGDHPAEQPFDPVHTGAFPAEVVADLENVQSAAHSVRDYICAIRA